jgi:pyrroline-5-carboxylate reductase
MNHQKIVFIGGGNMGSCLIAGLVVDGYSPQAINVVDPDPETRERMKQEYQISVFESPEQVMKSAEIVVLAVKPQIMESVVKSIKNLLDEPRPLIISIAAGIRTESLVAWLGVESPVVRTMPNTPAMVGSGATALYATKDVSTEQRAHAESVMRAVGIIQWLDDEALMDVVTAVSGSGPAYFFRVMEAMEKAAIKMGLSEEQARMLTVQTAFGASKMALESPQDPATLRVQVTSPGGTTERALNVLDQNNIDAVFEQALEAAKNRSAELSNELG